MAEKRPLPESPLELEHIGEIIAEHYALFVQFQNMDSSPNTRELKQKIQDFMDSDQDTIALSIFGAGFLSGIAMLWHMLRHAADAVNVMEQMQHLPRNKRPRA